MDTDLKRAKAQYTTIEVALNAIHLRRKIPFSETPIYSLEQVSDALQEQLILNWYALFVPGRNNQISYHKNDFVSKVYGDFSEENMFEHLGISESEWDTIKESVSKARDKFIAHVDIDMEAGDDEVSGKTNVLEMSLLYYREWLVNTFNELVPGLDKSVIYDNDTLIGLIAESSDKFESILVKGLAE
ncbi:hypothetical protein KW529_18770 [Vibrio fluvialis]|nr:hypothetical protein [Vibrio fluvialis]